MVGGGKFKNHHRHQRALHQMPQGYLLHYTPLDHGEHRNHDSHTRLSR